MKTHFQHIHFVVIEEKPKTDVWGCLNSKTRERLGVVRWYSPRRQYCFLPHQERVFDQDCLEEITLFIRGLNEKRRSGATNDL